MKPYVKYFVITALATFIIGCSSSKPDYESLSEIELYSSAEQELTTGNIQSSITLLEEMDKIYPFGPYSQQVQLNLIYSYYKSGEFALAVASIDRFIKLNPLHANIDWVIYMRGLSNMAQDNNQIQGWFNVDRSDRDDAFAKAAFKDFDYLVSRYPDSSYSYDAEKRMIYLKNRIARYQLKIAQFYTERGAYVAVVNRVSGMLQDFSDTDSTKRALVLMKNAYEQLGLTEEAQKTQILIAANEGNISKQSYTKPFLWVF